MGSTFSLLKIDFLFETLKRTDFTLIGLKFDSFSVYSYFRDFISKIIALN
jgi:hypothetical protein